MGLYFLIRVVNKQDLYKAVYSIVIKEAYMLWRNPNNNSMAKNTDLVIHTMVHWAMKCYLLSSDSESQHLFPLIILPSPGTLDSFVPSLFLVNQKEAT